MVNFSKYMAYLFILIGSFILFLRIFHPVIIPDHLNNWPIIITIVGLTIGLYSKFSHPSSFALVTIGTAFLFLLQMPMVYGDLIVSLYLMASGTLFLAGKQRLKYFVTNPLRRYSK